MIRGIRLSLIVLTASVASTAFAATADAGYVDFGKFSPSAKGEFVDVTLGRGLLKFAALFARHQDREAARLMSSITHVHVNVVGLDDSNRGATTDRMTALRGDLAQNGWDKIVTVQGKRDEDVAIFIKQRDGEVVEGIVVTVLDARKNEAVFVNIVGAIKAEELGAVGERLHIDRLTHLNPPEKS
jgi:hypothetical protein